MQSGKYCSKTSSVLKILILPFAIFSLGFSGYSQNITLSLDNAPLETAFKEIKKQSGYNFIYTREQLEHSRNLSLHVRESPFQQVINLCFKDQPFTYLIEDKYVIIREKEKISTSPPASPIDISGKVTDEKGQPLIGATITVKGSDKAVATNEKGEFILTGLSPGDILVVTNVGYQPQEILLNGKTNFSVQLRIAVNNLDETVIIAYGKTTRRLNTGNVSKVTSEQISREPVSNPMAVLQGRIPGLLVAQNNGYPGSSFNLLLRGQSSLRQGTGPLFIVDGVPFMTNNISGSLSQIGNPANQSPFSSLSLSDIESIEILKDADATAIYGSQGANGVVLITTKKGKAGATRLDINYYIGTEKVTRSLPLLNLEQYLAMRKEAFTNDNLVPSVSNAPDLLIWDTTRYTDWKKTFIGGSSMTSNLQLSLSGGNASTQFLFSADYYTAGTVFPGDDPDKKGSARLSISHSSANNKFKSNLTAAYSVYAKKFPFSDLTPYIYLPPDTPPVYDSLGKLSWANWVTGIDNPMAQLQQKYESRTNNLVSNGIFQYQLFPFVNIKLNLGYNQMQLREEVSIPIASLRPSATATGSHSIASASMGTWIVEPQAGFKKNISKGILEILTGSSFQKRAQIADKTDGTLYTNDDLLNNIGAAGLITGSNSRTYYAYTAVFGRINYNWLNKYIIDVNLRRDGSSRFGPANRFSNFGALGGSWTFSEEPFIKNKLKFISFGKLRSSYGVSGNDQISDYAYLDSWSTSFFLFYQGSAGILQDKLFNPYLNWERNRKFEIGLDIGLFENRFLFSASYYRNRSDNQLVFISLPYQTGFTSILKNLDALIQNSGVEMEFNTANILTKNWKWNTNLNISLPRNKLLRYPGLSISSDRFNYIIGQPLRIQFGYNYTGVNPQTGTYQFQDINGDGIINSPNDLVNNGFRGINFFGGFENNLHFKNWQLNILFYFVKQTGLNYLGSLSSTPGSLSNQPAFVFDRWQKPGDISSIQRFTVTSGTPAAAYSNFRNSSALLSDASFLRLKNLSLSYGFSQQWLKKYKLQSLRFYVQGENLVTWTGYKGADPETQNPSTLPPLRILTTGIQIIL